jgi:hypothetical protein
VKAIDEGKEAEEKEKKEAKGRRQIKTKKT